MPTYIVNLRIGEISLLVEGNNSFFISSLKKKYKNFLAERPLEINTKIFISHKKFSYSKEEISLENKHNLFYLQGEGFEGVFDKRRNVVEVTMDYHETIFDTFLRVFYSLILVLNKGILVHSLGVIKDYKGYLFIGPSSSGKTTMAKKVKNALILSDELVIVRRLENSFFLFSTPFGGELQREIRYSFAPLNKMFFLDRSIDGYRKEKGINALAMFLRNVFFFLKDKEYVENVIDFSRDLVYKFSPVRVNILSNCEVINGFV